MKTALITACLLFAGPTALAGEISDLYDAPEGGPKDVQLLDGHVAAEDHGISEFGIERSACFGACPIYTFIVRSDGRFRYTGVRYVDRVGTFAGSVPVWEFDRLARFIDESGYAGLKDGYAEAVTDNATVYTMAVMNGRRKIVSNYADAGPTSLWAVEALIDHLLVHAIWD
jgi:hypothetical protein